MAAKKTSGGRFRFVLGFVSALVLLGISAAVYLKFGHPPVAVADDAFPFEKGLVNMPLNARIDREKKTPPFGISEDVYEGGARVYKAEFASCHGSPGRDVASAKYMYPNAPQLWKRHPHGNVVGVSDDDAGETYWKVANGIRLTGMPSYSHILTATQMWQVSLLLKNADQPLPDPVMTILRQ